MSSAEYLPGKYGRFGPFGDDVGRRAVGVLAGLLEPVSELVSSEEGLVVWSGDDFRVFEHLTELETGIRLIEPHPDKVDGGDIADLHRAFGRFHVALPLSEAERLWLFDPLKIRRYEKGEPGIHEPETLLGVAEEVTSAGIKQVIQGSEVVRRLSAWRREQDEFAGQGTLDEAREALGEIALTLVTEDNWPRGHEDLRAELLDR
jgi:hypothetical protein